MSLHDKPVHGAGEPVAFPLPEIILEGGQLSRATDEAGRAVANEVYTRGGQIIRVTKPCDSKSGSDGVPNTAEIRPVDRNWMRLALARRAHFLRPDNRYSGGLREVDPPIDLANSVMAAADHMGFRPLRGVVTAPLIRLDGSLADMLGYDSATALFFDVPASVLDGIHLNPTRAEAEDAVRTLSALIKTFPFVCAADRSVALSAILTTLQRPVLPTAMMHVFDSPTPGTGKTKLTAVASAIGTGARAAATSVSSNEEETNKRLDGAILAGNPVLVLDNIEAPLGGDKLCSMLSEPVVSVRPLGASAVIRVPVTTTVMATGNNMRLRGDVTRRALIARLDAKVERPELRPFDNDPVADALTNRWQLVRAALTIVLAYHQAGCPQVARTIGNFEDWCRMVRDPLIWAGCADPAITMDRLREDDPALGDLTALLEAWSDRFGATPQLISDVVRTAQGVQSELADALEAVAGTRGEINKRRLGQYLRRNSDRVVAGHKIICQGKRQGSALWRVIEVP